MATQNETLLWEAVNTINERITRQSQAVSRIEIAIAGNPELQQQGMVARQNKAETEREDLDVRVSKLENWKFQTAAFMAGISAVIIIVWKIVEALYSARK